MTTSIRPRRASDLQACVEVMEAVYADSGYPVEGVGNALEALQTDEMAWVAVDSDSNSNDGGSSSSAAIVGHVAMRQARETDPYVALWRKKYTVPDGNSGTDAHVGEGEGEEVAVLGRLFVHPRARRRGLGARLVRVVEDEARRRGLRLLLLALGKDQDAIRLYRRLGWVWFGNVVYSWAGGDGEGESESWKMEAECFASPLPLSLSLSLSPAVMVDGEGMQ